MPDGVHGRLCPVYSYSWSQCLKAAAGTMLLVLLFASPGRAFQGAATGTGTQGKMAQNADAQSPAFRELEKKYPGLMEEFARLLQQLHANVQIPAPRSQSRLLEVLPGPAAFYMAVPNYGDSVHQALAIFRQELLQSQPLQNWWKDTAGKDGAQFEKAMQDFYEFSQYVGDDIVITSPAVTKEFSATAIAELRKPGLRDFMAHLNREYGPKLPLRVYSPQELAKAQDFGRGDDPVVLLRPDFVVASFDVATLRAMNKALEQRKGTFINTDLGRRVAQSYQRKISMVAAVDLQPFIHDANPGSQMMLQRTGFADATYGTWEFRQGRSNEPSISQMEVSFNGPRQGIASWLGSAGPLGALDFISAQPSGVFDLRLKNPATIYDDLRALATAANPRGFAMVDGVEQGLHMSIRNDILSKLGGEIAIETAVTVDQVPRFKVLLSTNDAAGLQQSLEHLLAGMGMVPKTHQEEGFTSYSVVAPNQKQAMEAYYAFVDNYLLVTMGHDQLVEAVRIHHSGESLARSQALQASLPEGTSADASGAVYQNLTKALAPALREAPPELARVVAQFAGSQKPNIMHLYADETSIRMVTSAGGYDPSMMLLVAAVAVPNLLRAKMAANEAAAMATIRTINTAQVTYQVTYSKGYARDLATLGPGQGNCTETDIRHACLIDGSLAGTSCASGTWCQKSDYKYTVSGICGGGSCTDYVAVATPANSGAGEKNFCSVSDAVVRVQPGPPLSAPVNAEECRHWGPVQ